MPGYLRPAPATLLDSADSPVLLPEPCRRCLRFYSSVDELFLPVRVVEAAAMQGRKRSPESCEREQLTRLITSYSR